MAKRNGNPKDPGYFFVNTGRGNFPVQIDSQMHRDLYNAGRLMTYDENRDQYVAPTLPEFTVSAKKNKTFLQEYVDKILQESKGAGIAETMFSVPMNAVTSLPQMALTKFGRKGLIAIASLFILIALNFAYFLPLYMGDLITYEAWRARMWFPSWI